MHACQSLLWSEDKLRCGPFSFTLFETGSFLLFSLDFGGFICLLSCNSPLTFWVYKYVHLCIHVQLFLFCMSCENKTQVLIVNKARTLPSEPSAQHLTRVTTLSPVSVTASFCTMFSYLGLDWSLIGKWPIKWYISFAFAQELHYLRSVGSRGWPYFPRKVLYTLYLLLSTLKAGRNMGVKGMGGFLL